MTEDSVINFPTEVDVAGYTRQILADQAALIRDHGKPVPQMLYFAGEMPIISVQSPPADDDGTRDAHLIKMFTLYPSLFANTIMVCFHNTLKFEDGLADALVVLTVIHNGVYAEAFPYRDVDGVIQFREGAELDTSFGQPYPLTVGHMLPTFSHTHARVAKPLDLINWLKSRGFIVQYFDGFSATNINKLGNIILDAIKKVSERSTTSDSGSGEAVGQA